jgi:hypothetical protein
MRTLGSFSLMFVFLVLIWITLRLNHLEHRRHGDSFDCLRFTHVESVHIIPFKLGVKCQD